MDKLIKAQTNGLEKKNVRHKLKWSKKEKQFLTNYAHTFRKEQSMIDAGLHLKRNGKQYSTEQLTTRANDLLKYPESKEYIGEILSEIREEHFLTLDKCIMETYEYYLELKYKSPREANISHSRMCDLLGFTGKNAINVNTQIVASEDGGITINYNQPDEKINKDKDETN